MTTKKYYRKASHLIINLNEVYLRAMNKVKIFVPMLNLRYYH